MEYLPYGIYKITQIGDISKYYCEIKKPMPPN